MEIVEYKGYGEFKAAMDKEVAGVAQGFVRMGYLLKVARDTDILRESGYCSVAEFAHAEYGLTKDIVSRYIAINDRFSEGGYSEVLNLKYKDYGVAKLAEMLTLSDEVIEGLSPQLTRKEIQEVKKDIIKEQEITDLEVLMEEKELAQQVLEDNLSKFLHQYGHNHPEQYVSLYSAVNETVYNGTIAPLVEEILNILAPTGIAMIRERLQGIGLLMLSIRGKDNDLELVNVRSNEKEIYTWDKLITSLENLCDDPDPRLSWQSLYHEPFPEKKEEVAPVQQEEEKPPVKMPENRINTLNEADFESEKEKEEKTEVKIEENVDFTENEEQLPGQMNVDDYPELKPDKTQIDYVDSTAAVPKGIPIHIEFVDNTQDEAPKSGENVDFTLSEADSEAVETDKAYRKLVTEYAALITANIKEQTKPIPVGVLDKCIDEAKYLLRLLGDWRQDREDEETN